MAHIALALYLVLVGLNILIDIDLPSWVFGTLALVAGGLMLAERFGFGGGKK